MNGKKILWAVDAFPDSRELQVHAGKTIGALFAGESVEVEPVYIARPSPPGLYVHTDPTLDMEYSAQAGRSLDWLIKRSKLSNVLLSRYLLAPTPSVGSMVKKLLEYAQEEKFDAIVVGTHARRGVPRLFMGSFAERLILSSPIPVLIVSAKSKKPESRYKHVVFPTDFSDASRSVFEKVVSFAKERKMEISIVHREEYLTPMAYPFIVPAVSQESLNEMKASWKKQGTEMAEWAKTQGVKASFALLPTNGSTSQSIVRYGKKFPGSLIALASQSNRAESFLLGSVARQIIREAACPVFVLHPEGLQKTAPRRSNGDG